MKETPDGRSAPFHIHRFANRRLSASHLVGRHLEGSMELPALCGNRAGGDGDVWDCSGSLSTGKVLFHHAASETTCYSRTLLQASQSHLCLRRGDAGGSDPGAAKTSALD